LKKAQQQFQLASSAGFFNPSCPGWFLGVCDMLELYRAVLDLGTSPRIAGDLPLDLDPC
jgi:hypothetical protein